MSGIAGVVPLDGAPVDPGPLGRMAELLARRGPDGRGMRALDGCGLVHTLLRTGDETAAPPQPCSVDGETWITADARIDARDELARALRAAGEDASPRAPAAELVLRAYRAWGTACVERLLGDFAFALWDGPRRRLFCARDPLGVKPFYYAATPGAFVFSNTLECVRLHPVVDGSLDDEAIADFLVHSFVWDAGRTVRRGVRMLPAAHRLVLEDGRHAVERYWELPRDEPLRHRGPAEYAEHFVEVLREAVRDRVPPAGASILLSGGRDSPAVAALAREGAAPGARFHGFTAYHDRLIYDDEPRYAALASGALGIPVEWLAVDGYRAFERFEIDPLLARPEPVDAPLLAIEVDQLRGAAARGPIVLTGMGGDPVLRETPSRLVRLAAGGRLLRAAAEAAQYAWWHRRVPRPGVRTWLSGAYRRPVDPVEAPPWIAPDFARRVDLAARIAEQNRPVADPHPLRPEAAAQLASSFWPTLFADYDPGVTGLPVEVRHPFFDLRVVRFTLAVPPAQWYNDKGLLRIGMRGRLPAPLLRRPKTPLREDPLEAHRRAEGDAWLDGRTLGGEVAPWVEVERVPRAAGGRAEALTGPVWPHLRPLGLSLWLRRRQP